MFKNHNSSPQAILLFAVTTAIFASACDSASSEKEEQDAAQVQQTQELDLYHRAQLLAGGTQWDHEVGGEIGPENWGILAPEFETCATGEKQSPINIESADCLESFGRHNFRRNRRLPRLKTRYKTVSYDAVDNGHTVQVNFPEGSFMKVRNKRFELLQFHYHTGSEHTIDGEQFPLELHLVHKTKSGKLGVVGVMVEAGAANDTLATVLENLPDPGSTRTESEVQINATGILPDSLAYYKYSGSLTTPPCTEGVKWHVLSTPITASQEQLDAFQNIYGDTFRPVQPLNGRRVRFSGYRGR